MFVIKDNVLIEYIPEFDNTNAEGVTVDSEGEFVLTVPDGIVDIKNDAFESLSTITEEIGECDQSIEPGFCSGHCWDCINWVTNSIKHPPKDERIKTVVLPASLREVSFGAFCFCTALKAVVVTGKDTVIEKPGFYFCSCKLYVTKGSKAEQYCHENKGRVKFGYI